MISSRKMGMMNVTEFASFFYGESPPENFTEYDAYQRLNHTLHTMIQNGSIMMMMPNESYSYRRDSLYVVIPITLIYIIIFITGVVGNVSTCIVIVRNKSMHTATNYYLFSLAISDLVLLVSGLPFEMSRMWYPDIYMFGEYACRLLGLSSETSTNATVLTITAFTVERYIAICHPFISHTMSKLSRVVKFIIAIWLLGLGLALPQALQYGILYSIEEGKVVSRCTVKTDVVEHTFVVSSFVFFVVPMTAITVLYVLIGVKLRTSRLLHSTKSPSCNSNPEQNGSGRIYKNNLSQSRAIKMLVAVAVCFFICWAPFHAQRLLAAILLKSDVQSGDFMYQVYNILTYISGVLYFLSTTINPVLYNIMSNKFREAFKNTIAHRCCCRRPRLADAKNRILRRENNNAARSRTIPSRTRQTSVNSMTKFSQEGNNNLKNKDSVKLAPGKAQLIEMDERQNFYDASNSLADKLLKSTKFIFKSKSDDDVSHDRRERIRRESANKSQSISNSSLQDMDEGEYSERELATFMGQVNRDIK